MKFMMISLLFISLLQAENHYSDRYKHDVDHFTFPRWKTTYDLTKGIMESDAHNAYVEIFVNKKALRPYQELHKLFPVGSRIFKPLYRDKEGKQFARLVIMEKMSKGYDTTNGDWWYGVYDESGTVMAYEGRIPECISCHALAKETDYLFSRSVMKKLRGVDTNEYEEYDPDDEEY